MMFEHNSIEDGWNDISTVWQEERSLSGASFSPSSVIARNDELRTKRTVLETEVRARLDRCEAALSESLPCEELIFDLNEVGDLRHLVDLKITELDEQLHELNQDIRLDLPEGFSPDTLFRNFPRLAPLMQKTGEDVMSKVAAVTDESAWPKSKRDEIRLELLTYLLCFNGSEVVSGRSWLEQLIADIPRRKHGNNEHNKYMLSLAERAASRT